MSTGSIGQQIINGTYGLDNRPPTAYEELKAWCEKYLEPEQFTVIPETESFLATIYFNTRKDMGVADYICFHSNGEFHGAGASAYTSKIEHCDEYEEEKTWTHTRN